MLIFNIEVVGWIGSTLVIISFFFDGPKMRVINGLGCLAWMFYAIVQGSMSLLFVNVAIICVHIYKTLSK
ncbi:MAG: YgjV family protein [Candidatus Marinimicrobia bacterium]|nr:YgjV family protein [Candidatus Neomarinimicrobiota bacterium]